MTRATHDETVDPGEEWDVVPEFRDRLLRAFKDWH